MSDKGLIEGPDGRQRCQQEGHGHPRASVIADGPQDDEDPDTDDGTDGNRESTEQAELLVELNQLHGTGGSQVRIGTLLTHRKQ